MIYYLRSKYELVKIHNDSKLLINVKKRLILIYLVED